MKKLLFIKTLIVIQFVATTYVMGQTKIYVRPYTGTQTAYLLTDIKSLTFGQGNVYVNSLTGNTAPYQLTDVRYLNFTDLTAGVSPQSVFSGYDFNLFPNPADQYIHIYSKHFEGASFNIDISSITGQVLIKEFIKNAPNTIHISVCSLPAGVYICRIHNEHIQISKKILKQ